MTVFLNPYIIYNIRLFDVFIIFFIHTKNNIDELTKEIPLLKKRLSNINSLIGAEQKNINQWKRPSSIGIRAKKNRND